MATVRRLGSGRRWFSKWHTVTLHYVINGYNDLIDHMAGIIQDFAKKKTHSKDSLYRTVKFALHN